MQVQFLLLALLTYRNKHEQTERWVTLDAKDLAYKDYLAGMKYKDIAEKYNVSLNTVKSWKTRNNWNRKENAQSEKVCTQNEKGAHKKKKGGQPGNKNAVGNSGGAAPVGNLNAIKHGAYQTIYAAYLPEEEKEIYDQMPGEADLESEIKLLRLKMARLLNRKDTHIYDMFGNKHDLELSEEERDKGILACSEQLEKLVKTQNLIKRMAKDDEEQDARIAKLKAEVSRINADKGTGIGSVYFAGEGDLVD